MSGVPRGQTMGRKGRRTAAEKTWFQTYHIRDVGCGSCAYRCCATIIIIEALAVPGVRCGG